MDNKMNDKQAITPESESDTAGLHSTPVHGYVTGYTVRSIKHEETYDWLLNKHYAKRIPSISWAYGIYSDRLMGVITYGTPASSPLREGIAGKENIDKIIELNRVCCENAPNLASYFISKTLKMLPAPKIIVSFADAEQGHHGYIYQATNWLYTGLSAKRTDWKVKGMEHLHGTTIADKSRGQKNRVEYMRQTYGDDFYLQDRPRKHRYIYLIGNKREVRQMRQQLRYNIMPYPKGDNKQYDASYEPVTQQVMF